MGPLDTVGCMEDNTPHSPQTPAASSRVVAILILATVLGTALFAGSYLALSGRSGSVDPVTAREIADAESKNPGTLVETKSTDESDPAVVLAAQVKLWHFDAGRLIGPTVSILGRTTPTPESYRTACDALSERNKAFGVLPVAPSPDVATAFDNWRRDLDRIDTACSRSDWKAFDAAVLQSTNSFGAFVNVMSEYDPSLQPVAPEAAAKG